MVFLAGGDVRRFVQQYSESGLKGRIAIVGKKYLVDENIFAQVGQAAADIVTESHWSFLLDNPENVQFKAAYTKKYGHPPTVLSEQGYVTEMAIAAALNKTEGKIRGRDFVQTMRSLELKAPRGVIKFPNCLLNLLSRSSRSHQFMTSHRPGVVAQALRRR